MSGCNDDIDGNVKLAIEEVIGETFRMKKIMGMMLGMSLLMGTVALFADDAKPADTTKPTATKKKSAGKKKKKDTTVTTKS